MKINAYAKLNLLLNVHGKCFNGYHSLETIMIPIGLHDVLEIDIINNSDDIIITTNDSHVPTDKNNILHKCITLYKKQFNISCGFKIYLKKNIPVSSGLGGESADAAALMRFFAKQFNLNLSYSDIFYFGRLLGWDVPVCYFQKTIYIDDLNNTFEFIENKANIYILLVKPSFGILTKDAFENLDKRTTINKNASPLVEALITGEKIGGLLHNTFIISDNALLEEYNKLTLYSKYLGLDGVSMTGTGSCFFLVSSNLSTVKKSYLFLKDKYPYVYVTQILRGKQND